MLWLAVTPFTVYDRVPLLASLKLRLTAPAANTCTRDESKVGPNGGPVVRNSEPAQVVPLRVQVATYHIAFPLPSNTYQARNIALYCCVIAIPQPDSAGFHQMSV